MVDHSKIHVLHLPRWYPHKYDPMPGLFTRFHAEAVAEFSKSSVVYVHPDPNITGSPVITKDWINGVFTVNIYTKHQSGKCGIIHKPRNAWRYCRAILKGIGMVRKEHGTINLIHVHVLTRLGLIALMQKWLHGTPYVITEHWSRYLPVTGTYSGRIRKFVTKMVVKNAWVVTTVTENLRKAMESHGLQSNNYTILPNIVDSERFNIPKDPHHNRIRMLHVSCFEDRSKNITGILNVINKLKEIRNDFECLMVGDGEDFGLIKGRSDEMGLTDQFVYFKGLLEDDDLVSQFKESDFLILFSHYENMPVVINEAFSCGMPVVATRVGGIPEYVDKSNGLLAEPGNEKDMLDKILTMMDSYHNYNRNKIRKQALNSFSREAVIKKLKSIYNLGEK